MVKTKCEGIFVIYPLRANQPLKRMNNTTKTFRKTTDSFLTIAAKHNPTSYNPFPCARQAANPSAFIPITNTRISRHKTPHFIA